MVTMRLARRVWRPCKDGREIGHHPRPTACFDRSSLRAYFGRNAFNSGTGTGRGGACWRFRRGPREHTTRHVFAKAPVVVGIQTNKGTTLQTEILCNEELQSRYIFYDFDRGVHLMKKHLTQRRSMLRTVQHAVSTTSSVGNVVDLSGDGGVTRELLEEGDGKGLATGDIAKVRFTGTVEETGLVFTEGSEYRTTLEDGTMISGWDTGLAGLRPGDRAVIRCTSRYGYGNEGVPPVVPPNANLVFDVELLEYEGNIMNPATFIDTNPLTPRTPASITEAFNLRTRRRMEEKESMDDLEGLDKVRAWLQNIYIFGLFEGATGQEAPWYLKPVITFPIMIGLCGLAFYVVIVTNAISTERPPATVEDDPLLASIAAHAFTQWSMIRAS